MANVTYAQVERLYKEMVAAGYEPNLIPCRMLKKTKAVRRVIGRLLRQGRIPPRSVGPMVMKGKSGFCTT